MDIGESIILSNEQFLEIVGEIASLFHQVISIENTIAVTDKERFIECYLGQEAAGHSFSGKPFPQQSNIPTVLRTGTPINSILPKEVYGVPFKSSTIPIKYNDDIIGTLSLALSLGNQNTLQNVAENLSSSAEQLTATTEEIASSATVLSNNVVNVLTQTEDIIKLLEQTNIILDFVNKVASDSKLLSLNAHIEAAKAGETGKGFLVVANEIRKMAENSMQAVNNTKKLISSINDRVNHLLGKTQELSDIAQTQAASTQEIAASVQELASNSQTIQKISQII